jgi:hypothetical protein
MSDHADQCALTHAFARELAAALTLADKLPETGDPRTPRGSTARADWTYEPQRPWREGEDEPELGRVAYIVSGDLRLAIESPGWPKSAASRWKVWGAFSQASLEGRAFHPWNAGEAPDGQITVSKARPAGEVAREVVRRCLPTYAPARVSYLIKLAAEDAEVERDWRIMRELGITRTDRPADRRRDGYRYMVSEEHRSGPEGGPSATLTYHGHGHCKLELTSLSPEQALAIAATLGLK